MGDPYVPGGGKAWGISFPTLRLAITQDCYKRGELSFELCPREQGGQLDGMVLHFELNMVARTMWVAVNDGPFVECIRSLPPTVRIWALLASEGDSITLTPSTRIRKVPAPGAYIP